MHEKLVIVPRKKSTVKKILNVVWFVLACLCFLFAMWVPILFAVPAIIFAIIWYFQAFRSDIEYEYTYYDGEFRFARIKAKRKRKGLGRVQMEDVLALAPKGDRSVYKYENDNSLACKDLTSGESGTKIYELVFKGEKGINRYEFEPDEEMLDAVMVKYPRAVIKQGTKRWPGSVKRSGHLFISYIMNPDGFMNQSSMKRIRLSETSSRAEE